MTDEIKAKAMLRRIAKAFEAGEVRPLERLLENYALWAKSRTGVPHYHGPLANAPSGNFERELAHPETTLTDTEGMLIDHAVAESRQAFPLGWCVFVFYYFRGFTLRDLARQRDLYAVYRTIRRKIRKANLSTTLLGTKDEFFTRVYFRFLLEISRRLM